MILSIAIDFIVGFFAHRMRPYTLRYERRLGDLMRYAIGLILFIPLGTLAVSRGYRRHMVDGRRSSDKGLTERVFIDLLVAAVAYGGGVAVGFLTDGGLDG